MPRPQPDSDPDGFWPSCDQERPGVSIRPLRHADLAALLAHPDHHQDAGDTLGSGFPAPVVAVRVRASVGRPGASAAAEYRHRRGLERARWTRGLPWRIAAVLTVGLTAWLLATQVAAHLAALASVTVAAGLGWRLRFRPAPPPWPGGAERPGSGARPACWPPWSGAAGRCCTIWPSLARRPTSIAMIPGAAAAARSDPNVGRPGALRVDLSTGAVAAAGRRPAGRP